MTINTIVKRSDVLPLLVELAHLVDPDLALNQIRSVAFIPQDESGGPFLEVQYFIKNTDQQPLSARLRVPIVYAK